MACRVGEPVKGTSGGWLGRRPKLWRLPFHMHPMAEVCSCPACFLLCRYRRHWCCLVTLGSSQQVIRVYLLLHYC